MRVAITDERSATPRFLDTATPGEGLRQYLGNKGLHEVGADVPVLGQAFVVVVEDPQHAEARTCAHEYSADAAEGPATPGRT